MIRSNQLILAMVGLATGDIFLAIERVCRQLIGPVHPVDSGVYMVLIASTYLEDSSNPVVVRLQPQPHLVPVGQ